VKLQLENGRVNKPLITLCFQNAAAKSGGDFESYEIAHVNAALNVVMAVLCLV
jgi:hypothetical protein